MHDSNLVLPSPGGRGSPPANHDIIPQDHLNLNLLTEESMKQLGDDKKSCNAAAIRSPLTGVHFDKKKNRWVSYVTPRKCRPQKRVYFAVSRFGFWRAKNEAIRCRLENDRAQRLVRSDCGKVISRNTRKCDMTLDSRITASQIGQDVAAGTSRAHPITIGTPSPPGPYDLSANKTLRHFQDAHGRNTLSHYSESSCEEWRMDSSCLSVSNATPGDCDVDRFKTKTSSWQSAPQMFFPNKNHSPEINQEIFSPMSPPDEISPHMGRTLVTNAKEFSNMKDTEVLTHGNAQHHDSSTAEQMSGKIGDVIGNNENMESYLSSNLAIIKTAHLHRWQQCYSRVADQQSTISVASLKERRNSRVTSKANLATSPSLATPCGVDTSCPAQIDDLIAHFRTGETCCSINEAIQVIKVLDLLTLDRHCCASTNTPTWNPSTNWRNYIRKWSNTEFQNHKADHETPASELENWSIHNEPLAHDWQPLPSFSNPTKDYRLPEESYSNVSTNLDGQYSLDPYDKHWTPSRLPASLAIPRAQTVSTPDEFLPKEPIARANSRKTFQQRTTNLGVPWLDNPSTNNQWQNIDSIELGNYFIDTHGCRTPQEDDATTRTETCIACRWPGVAAYLQAVFGQLPPAGVGAFPLGVPSGPSEQKHMDVAFAYRAFLSTPVWVPQRRGAAAVTLAHHVDCSPTAGLLNWGSITGRYDEVEFSV